MRKGARGPPQEMMILLICAVRLLRRSYPHSGFSVAAASDASAFGSTSFISRVVFPFSSSTFAFTSTFSSMAKRLSSESLQDLPPVYGSFVARRSFFTERGKNIVGPLGLSGMGVGCWMRELTLGITISSSGPERRISTGSPLQLKEIGVVDENV